MRGGDDISEKQKLKWVLENSKLFEKLRKIFDKQSDREAQVEALDKMSDDFVECCITIDVSTPENLDEALNLS